MLALVVVTVLAQASTGGLDPSTLVGFGAASPIVAVFFGLMVQANRTRNEEVSQANRARDEAQAAHLADLRSVVPAIQQSTVANDALADAFQGLADEYRADLRERRER